MVSPEELARYDSYWDNVSYQKATEARDALIKNTVGVCAEFQSANILLNQGGILENIRFTEAIRPRTGQIIPTCTNCSNIFDILK